MINVTHIHQSSRAIAELLKMRKSDSCIICSTQVTSGIRPSLDTIKSFARLYVDLHRNDNFVPNFTNSDFLIFCPICFSKMHQIHELFTKLDFIQSQLNDFRLNIYEALMKGLQSSAVPHIESNSLRRQIIRELCLNENTENTVTSIMDPKCGSDYEDSMEEQVSFEPEVNIKIEPHDYIIQTETDPLLLPTDFVYPNQLQETSDVEPSYQESRNSKFNSSKPRKLKCPRPISKSKKQGKSTKEADQPPKPPYTIIQMISQAILSQPRHQATIRDIYEYMIANFPYYRYQMSKKYDGWQNSVRHTLSVNNRMFCKVGRNEVGGGRGWWEIEPSFKGKLSTESFIARGKQGQVIESRSNSNGSDNS